MIGSYVIRKKMNIPVSNVILINNQAFKYQWEKFWYGLVVLFLWRIQHSKIFESQTNHLTQTSCIKMQLLTSKMSH